MKTLPLMSCLRSIGFFIAAVLIAAGTARAQSQYAGNYVGTLNTRVTSPGVTSIESSFGVYLAVVSADGTFNLNSGALTGSVSASGAVTINAGTSFALLNIRSATIANNQLSSDYGAPSAPSNNTSSYRINPSTGFTPAAGGGGGGTGGGGTGGGGTGGGGTGGGGTTGGDLLAYYSFDNASNPLRDESGRNFHLTALGQVSRIDGRFGAGDPVAQALNLPLQAVDLLPLRRNRLVQVLDGLVLVRNADFEGVEARGVCHWASLAQHPLLTEAHADRHCEPTGRNGVAIRICE